MFVEIFQMGFCHAQSLLVAHGSLLLHLGIVSLLCGVQTCVLSNISLVELLEHFVGKIIRIVPGFVAEKVLVFEESLFGLDDSNGDIGASRPGLGFIPGLDAVEEPFFVA
jgi:hypothetical protein